jgi:hypothetical protein
MLLISPSLKTKNLFLKRRGHPVLHTLLQAAAAISNDLRDDFGFGEAKVAEASQPILCYAVFRVEKKNCLKTKKSLI